MVDVWLAITERQAVGRGPFAPSATSRAKIRAFINGWNNRKHPLVRTKTQGRPEQDQPQEDFNRESVA